MFLRSVLYRPVASVRASQVRGLRNSPVRTGKSGNTSAALHKWLGSEIESTRDWRKSTPDLQALRDFLQTNGWKVDYTNDKATIVGTYQTYEEIRISVDVGDQQQQTENETNEQEDYFKIDITKDGQVVSFFCCAHSGEIEIDTVGVAPVDDEASEITIPFSQIEEEGAYGICITLTGNDFSEVIAATFAEHEQVYYEQWAGKLKLFFD